MSGLDPLMPGYVGDRGSLSRFFARITGFPPANACLRLILGFFPKTCGVQLPKVRSRGHVYPLSYLPYF